MQQIKNRFNRVYEISDDDIYWRKMLSKGIFQINNIRMLHKLKPNARTIIDIGANIGSNTIEYATWAKTVHSFEPTPELFNQLNININLNKTNIDTVRWHDDVSMNQIADVHTYQCALGNEVGNVYLKAFTNNKGKNHITNNNQTILFDDVIPVQVNRLDDYNITDVDIIKIDVEGYELFVLQGAENTIMKYKPVIQTELHQGLFKRQGLTIQDIAEWFYQHDYYAIDKKGQKQPETLPTEHSGIDLFWISRK
jgi:FkbM family methyltransferase